MDFTHWATASPAGCGLCGSFCTPIYFTPVGWRCVDVIACVMRMPGAGVMPCQTAERGTEQPQLSS